ncbi:MAG: glycoside hydrolase family 32 protein [Spirochaetia bacterium]|nr:glycoside hydrolase family 32 protein [Spirochaetia bacterium]
MRPQCHFSPRWGWIGDPNGLVFDKGEYHMFFQYNPYATKWGNMHWGHAVSPDLLHWKEWPIELYPPKFGDNPYSGSAVVDGERITLIFPSTGRGICLAMSANGGKNFSEFEGNPISKGNFGGDPRVFWHEATKRWVMITCKILKTAPEAPPGTPGWLGKATCAFLFYTSTDLKNWEYQSQVEDCWECPDLFALAVDGDPRQTKWVLLANSTPSLVAKGKYAGGRYLIGDFDGKAFKAEGERLQLNFGNAYGAAQSYNGIPAADGRRINVGCAFGSKMPSMPFAQMMNFPTELSLRSTADGLRLCTLPIREIKTLHTNTRIFENVAATPEGTRLPGVEGDLFDISAELSPDAETEELGLMVRGIPITYRIGPAQLVCADRSATLKPEGNWVKLRLLVDRVSIEIFANEGLVYMPMAVLPKDGERGISVFAKGGAPKTVKLTVHSLASAWENVKK